MTREEAAKRWEWVIENFNDSSVYLWPDQRQELLASIALLRGPQPDPDTGLVPCGCGEKMRIDIPPGNDSVRARWRKLTAYSVGIEPVEYHYTCRVCRKHFWNYDCKDTELQKFIQKGGRGMSKNDWRQKATWFFVGLLIGIAFLLLKRWLTI